MTATEERTPTQNRCAGYFDEIQNAKLPKLPAEPKTREQIYQDAVLQSVIAMQKLLTHDNIDQRIKAAELILALEKTRMRHGSDVTGTQPAPPPPRRSYLADGTPAPIDDGEYARLPEELKDDELYKVYKKHLKVAKEAFIRRAKECPNQKIDTSGYASSRWVRQTLDELEKRADELPLDTFSYEKTTWM